MIEPLTPVAALIAGLVGSGHCILMCGGIAGALELSARQGGACAGGALRYPCLYNLGRIASYAAAGAIAGGLGGAALALANLPRARIIFALLAALVVIVMGLRLAAGLRQFGALDRAGAAAWRRIAPLTKGLFPVNTPARAFGVGLAWGWLPCGMAYAMLAAAWLSGTAISGAAIMAMFGLGTLPAMLALGGSTARLLGTATRRWGGALLVVIGLASGATALWPADIGGTPRGGPRHLHHSTSPASSRSFAGSKMRIVLRSASMTPSSASRENRRLTVSITSPR
jgi:sulfite exporter TauE/SafE